MTTTTTEVSDPCRLATPSTLEVWAGDFARALKAGGAMARTAKLETTLFTKGSIDRLFMLEMAIIAGWPGGAAPPRHELRCDPSGGERLRLAAFDEDGALLLEQSFSLHALKPGEVRDHV